MYTSWSKVPGRRSPGLARTRHRPPSSVVYEIAASSGASLRRNSGSSSRERSRRKLPAWERRFAARLIRRNERSTQRHDSACDCAGLIRTQEKNCVSDLLSLDVMHRSTHGLHVRSRANGRWREGVRANAIRSFFGGDCAHEREDAGLGHSVGGHLGNWSAGKCSLGGEKDDRATAGAQEWKECAGGEKRGGEIDPQLPVPDVVGALGDRATHREPAGHVHEGGQGRTVIFPDR